LNRCDDARTVVDEVTLPGPWLTGEVGAAHQRHLIASGLPEARPVDRAVPALQQTAPIW